MLRTVRAFHPRADTDVIERAYEVAAHAHRDQRRRSGEPYITLPLAVGGILYFTDAYSRAYAVDARSGRRLRTSAGGFSWSATYSAGSPTGSGKSNKEDMIAAANKTLGSAEMKQLLDREGAGADPQSLAQLADLLPREIALYRKMAQLAGMKAE